MRCLAVLALFVFGWLAPAWAFAGAMAAGLWWLAGELEAEQ